jgi:hypothetical protein
VLPDVTQGCSGAKQLTAAGGDLEAVTAMLDGLSVEELEVLSERVQEVIKLKRALPVAVE